MGHIVTKIIHSFTNNTAHYASISELKTKTSHQPFITHIVLPLKRVYQSLCFDGNLSTSLSIHDCNRAEDIKTIWDQDSRQFPCKSQQIL